VTGKPACDPLDLSSHDWQPFGRQQTLLKCARENCGIVTTQMLFQLPRAHLP